MPNPNAQPPPPPAPESLSTGSLTDLSAIRALCQKHGIHPSKGFGQNFLVNPGICPKICEAAGVGPTSHVLEIGPGFGTLTVELARRAGRVASVEVDKHLLPVLAETLADFDNVHVIEGDILKLDVAALLKTEFGGPAIVCANLPYNITSPIVMKLLEDRLPLESLTVMVQKEAAQRITAPPGTRLAGAITYAVHYYATPRLCFSVKPGSFYPAPKIISAVVKLDIHKKTALPAGSLAEKQLFSLIRAGFSQRRKTLQNSASQLPGLTKEQLATALAALGLPPTVRPEQLTLAHFLQLQAALWG